MFSYYLDHILRPFLNWNRTGEFPKKEADAYQKIYAEADNMSIDAEKSYFNTIFNSDCLISDTSSFIADYFTTGKPIIYCHKVDTFNELSKKMSEGFYWVHNWEELKKVLDDLKNGKDILKERRLAITAGIVRKEAKCRRNYKRNN